MKVFNSGVQAQEFLSAFPPPESMLLAFLTPCGTVRLLNQIVTSDSRDHLLMVDIDQARNLPNRGSIAPELIGTDRVWDIVFSQKPPHEVFGGLGIAVSLEQDIKHEAVLVHRPPQPVSNPVHTGADLVQKPPGTPSGFPVTQASCGERAELDGPFAKCFVTDHDAALVQQFLNIPVTQGKTVVEPDSVLNDGHWKAVAVGLDVRHGWSAYPEPVKANALGA